MIKILRIKLTTLICLEDKSRDLLYFFMLKHILDSIFLVHECCQILSH